MKDIFPDSYTIQIWIHSERHSNNPVFLLFSRKDQHLLSSVNCWYLVLNQTRRESRDHATLSDIYTNNVIVRLAQICEDVIRLFKKVSATTVLPSLFTTNFFPQMVVLYIIIIIINPTVTVSLLF